MNDNEWDDEPINSRRCYGPAIPNAHGCGRYIVLGSGMCQSCDQETRSYWTWQIDQDQANDKAQEEYYRQEAEYYAAEKAAHPAIVTRCAWCLETHICTWQGYDSYICADRAQCDARCLDMYITEMAVLR